MAAWAKTPSEVDFGCLWLSCKELLLSVESSCILNNVGRVGLSGGYSSVPPRFVPIKSVQIYWNSCTDVLATRKYLVPDASPLVTRHRWGQDMGGRCESEGQWFVTGRPQLEGTREICWRCLIAIRIHLLNHLRMTCHIWMSKSQHLGSPWLVIMH